MDVHAIRKDYKLGNLDVKDVLPLPIDQFKKWFEEALKAEILEPNAMILSTVSEEKKPHSRVVLVKDINENGLSFFTNYHSNKGKQIRNNNSGSLLFFWPELERQVRFEGEIEKLTAEESLIYYHSRPRSSQIGAHVSPQSQVIPNREYLETIQSELERKFDGLEIPIPDYWGGYLFRPTSIEFWQGRPSRLHDRLLYKLQGDKNWKIERLAP
ncbi:MAG: pyridoxamine 5'-phosphate oxidase [Cytophagales bacterium]